MRMTLGWRRLVNADRRLRRMAATTAVGLCLIVVISGCGMASPTTSATVASGKVAPAATGPVVTPATTGAAKPLSKRVLQEVNVVCSAVRHGAPAILVTAAKPAAVHRYATSARIVTQRTIISLQRLAAQNRTSLRPLIAGYQQLQGVYTASAATPRTPAHVAAVQASAIQRREQAVSSEARAMEAPACGVAGR
jgi:hypothetical protein